MSLLSGAAGSWTGTNGFRLLPGDDLAEYPATLTVTPGAGGHLASVAYTWRHPSDGPQEGLLVIAPADEDGGLVALWGDSWHQKPTAMSLTGRADPAVALEADYGGDWLWRITLDDADPDELRLRRDTVCPAGQATDDSPPGPYPAMLMSLRRR